MTKEEVIEQLKDLRYHCEDMIDPDSRYKDTWEKDVEALSIAIKTIKKEPKAPQQIGPKENNYK